MPKGALGYIVIWKTYIAIDEVSVFLSISVLS